jgi:hypothetical protein
MDPLSALAVAGAVVQFVDFGTKFVSEVASRTSEIYQASQMGDNDDAPFGSINKILERDVNSISIVTAKIMRPLRPKGSSIPLSADEKALLQICDGCNDIAQEMSNHLNGLKIRTDVSQSTSQKECERCFVLKDPERLSACDKNHHLICYQCIRRAFNKFQDMSEDGSPFPCPAVTSDGCGGCIRQEDVDEALKASQAKGKKNWKDWREGIDKKTKAFLKGFKAVWTEDELNNMSERLSMLKKRLELHCLVSIRSVN